MVEGPSADERLAALAERVERLEADARRSVAARRRWREALAEAEAEAGGPGGTEPPVAAAVLAALGPASPVAVEGRGAPAVRDDLRERAEIHPLAELLDGELGGLVLLDVLADADAADLVDLVDLAVDKLAAGGRLVATVDGAEERWARALVALLVAAGCAEAGIARPAGWTGALVVARR